MKKINILILSVLSLLFTSCDDMLDLKPESTPSDAVIWNSASSFEKEVNNYYTFLPYFQNKSNNGVLTLRGIFDRDIMSDLYFYKDSEDTYSNSTYTPSETDGIYQEYFKNIRSINYFFKNYTSYSKKEEIEQYRAEALFFRAYISFRVFKDYGPLTIVKDVMETYSPELNEARASRDDFANFIIGDLEDAIASNALPLQKNIASTSTNGRIALGAAQALLAEVCLFEGTWQKYHYNNTSRANELLQKAVDYSLKVMADDSYKLFYNSGLGVDSYRYMFTLESVSQANPVGVLKEANSEYIFRNRFHENVRQLGQNIIHAARFSNMSRKFVESFLDKNGKATTPDYKSSLNSYYKDRDPRLASMSVAPGDFQWTYANASNFQRNAADTAQAAIRSWDGPGFYVDKFSTERTVGATMAGFDVPIIRLAEVFLIYAEAKCELANGVISDADLNKSINLLRDRVHMPHLTSTTVPVGSSLLEEIRKERTRELYLEGFRFDDLRRWKTAEVDMSSDLEGVYIESNSAFAKDWTIISIYGQAPYTYLANDNTKNQMSQDGYVLREASSRRTFRSKNYLLPIPTMQIELNPKLEQNPGWE